MLQPWPGESGSGSQARDAGQYDAAEADYEHTLALVPGFPDAERRLSYMYMEFESLLCLDTIRGVALHRGSGGLIYFYFTIGRIPVQPVVIPVLSGFYALVAIGRSIFFRPGSDRIST